jgi:hypothetical protein
MLVDKQLNNLWIMLICFLKICFKTESYRVFQEPLKVEKMWITFLKSLVKTITQAAENR